MDVTTDDNCHLWTAATGHGNPLVMCHGGPGLWDMAGSLADRLAGRLEVIRWDQRGCGRSGLGHGAVVGSEFILTKHRCHMVLTCG